MGDYRTSYNLDMNYLKFQSIFSMDNIRNDFFEINRNLVESIQQKQHKGKLIDGRLKFAQRMAEGLKDYNMSASSLDNKTDSKTQ